jgi:hypothetical protein
VTTVLTAFFAIFRLKGGGEDKGTVSRPPDSFLRVCLKSRVGQPFPRRGPIPVGDLSPVQACPEGGPEGGP